MDKDEKSKQNITKRKRCPKGQYYDRITNGCKPKIQIQLENTEPASVQPAEMKGINEFFGEFLSSDKKESDSQAKPLENKQKRCPKGEHRDLITHKCVKKHTRVVIPKIKRTKIQNYYRNYS